MLIKNQQLELDIDSLSSDGAGIARYNNFIVFVKGACAGERVLAQIILVRKSFAAAKVLRIISTAECRAKPPCPVYGKCGGCNIMHLNYSAQLAFKRGKVKENFIKTAKISNPIIEETVASGNIFNYRNKLSLPVRKGLDGKTEIGFFAPLSHRVVPTNECLIQSKSFNGLIGILKKFMLDYNVEPYDEQRKKGIVRHFVARYIHGSLIAAIVVNGTSLPHSRALGDTIVEQFGKNASVHINYNNKNNNVILGDEFYFLCGNKNPEIEIFGIKISLHPASFFQVNEDVFTKLYSEVKNIIEAIKPDYIIDAYCGAGLLSCLLSKICGRIIGVDICKEAIDDAKKCAKTNGITNADFIVGDCADKLPQLIEKYKNENSVLILDPPRKGCEKNILQSVLNSEIKNIIYISCDPATLARDIETLKSRYTVALVRPYDMFPQTDKVETLSLLTLKG